MEVSEQFELVLKSVVFKREDLKFRTFKDLARSPVFVVFCLDIVRSLQRLLGWADFLIAFR